jgi:hypothetical protein
MKQGGAPQKREEANNDKWANVNACERNTVLGMSIKKHSAWYEHTWYEHNWYAHIDMPTKPSPDRRIEWSISMREKVTPPTT